MSLGGVIIQISAYIPQLINNPKEIINYFYSSLYPSLWLHNSSFPRNFENKKATYMNLIFLKPVSNLVDTRYQLNSIYTDLFKAFVQLDHGTFLCLFHSYMFTD